MDLPPERREAYRAELLRVREAGCAISREELIAGAVAIAVPLFMSGDRVVGSLAVYGPSARIDDQQIMLIVEQLKSASTQITKLAG